MRGNGRVESLLRVEHLKKYFPARMGFFGRSAGQVKAVDDIDIELYEGETFSLVGESGCGKSTTGRLILRLIEPSGGRIWFRGQDITSLSRKAMRPVRDSMQIIFQDPYSSLNPRMAVKDIIGEGLKNHTKMTVQERKDVILDVMRKVGLHAEHYDRYPHEFSGGQRQRIGIARAIILNPKLVVADEPLSALDVSTQAQVINLLESLKHDLNLSYLLITHDLSVVEHISDRIAVMYVGRIVELATRERFFGNPRHPYTVALFSAIPVPKIGHRKKRIILKGEVPSPMNPPSGCRFHPRCHYAQEICSELAPILEEIEPGHWTACHFPMKS